MSRNVTGRIAHMLDLPFGEPRILGRPCGTTAKIAYRDEPSAERALALMQVRRQILTNMGKPQPHVESRHYRCNTCPGWHLTSKEYVAPRAYGED